MSRLRIRERIARKTRALVLLHCRNMVEVASDIWLVYHMSSAYTLARLGMDDTPTTLARRDVTNFFSPQDCINFLRFTQPQVRLI